MDRRAGLALAIAALGCGARPAAPTVLSRGVLAYAVAAAPTTIASVELSDRFELVLRDWPALAPRTRVDLGPPEADVLGLALTPEGARALVGGRDGWVGLRDAHTGAELARWPQGAPVTALAASIDDGYVGDATGVVCRRRLGDGALLVCVDVGAPVAALALDAQALHVERTDAPPLALAPGDLRATPTAATPPAWTIAGPVITWRGTPHRFAAAVRGAALAPDGRLLVAAWVATLDDAALVLLPARP